MKYDVTKLKPFDLERAKAGDPVCTRDGEPVRIICFDRRHLFWTIVALVGEDEDTKIFTTDGKWQGPNNITDEDLMMAPKTKKLYANLYKNINGIYHVGDVCDYLVGTTILSRPMGEFIKILEIEIEE